MDTTTTPRGYGILFPVILGLLTAFGPFVTDFYLPVLPEMGRYFHTSSSLVSLSLTTGMLGLAIGQLMIGPVTDKFGRHRILVGAMLLFVVSSIGCIYSKNILVFNTMRLFQGLGGAGGIVISKSMASDMYSGRALAKFMALLGAINGVAPVVAPVIGGAMSEVGSWQSVFMLLLAIGVLLTAGSIRLPETLSHDRRVRRTLAGTYLNLFRVFRNRRYTAVIIFTVSGAITFFGYIASSTFIMQQVYGLSPLAFSLCFGANALMIAIGAALAGAFSKRMTGIKTGAVVQFAGAAGVAACLLCGMGIWWLMGSYIVMLTGFGLWQPGAVSLALDLERSNSGAASAVFGATFFMAGAIASPIVAIGDISLMTSIISVGGTLLSLPIVFILGRHQRD